eukprot:CAMPEP_0174955638 /NCGR_PEP_ID=MMETSP0004_2-20121128/1091_1 /TAXON_ID=420556 /ORGANISM="Ochromonas sp., Strain CCMP1393" /LENGTH=1031 /DNA_ID=CAMNT_0016203585 /DNA_START=104 /DNA_END=3199 /DNA_ORIENTATION=-
MYGGTMDRNERRTMNRQNQEAFALRKANNDTQFFWEMVQRNQLGRSGYPQPRRPNNRAQDEKVLFSKKVETVEKGFIDNNIPVERSGPRADEIPVLSAFSELEGMVPPFVFQNIQRMQYEVPTPIQKHAVPLGLAGCDMMCCAQTGSGKTFSFLLPVVATMQRSTYIELPDPAATGLTSADPSSGSFQGGPPESAATGSAAGGDGSTGGRNNNHHTKGKDPADTGVAATPHSEDADNAIDEQTTSSSVTGSTSTAAGAAADGSAAGTGTKAPSTSNDPAGTSTGTGTAAPPKPAVTMVQRISVDQRGSLPLAIILAPTRELASQIHLDARRLTFNSTLKTVCCYGGSDLRQQLTELSSGCDLIVATPGRLNDLVDRGCVALGAVTLLVLDEADRMLDMGFEPQIRRIIEQNDMPPTGSRQTFMFSATFPKEIQQLAGDFLQNYVWIGVGRVGSTVENITQKIMLASSNPMEKLGLLMAAIEQTEGRTLIFVQKRRTATWLCDCLRGQYRIRAEEIHGDRTQAQREHALRQFRDGHIRILVATDVAARGLDIPAVTHVIQFDLPLSADDFDVYVHRIGRTGRAGNTGLATALFVPGREVGEGNGKIAPQMLQLLTENNQEIPDWFAQLDDHRSTHNNHRSGYGNRPQQRGGYYGSNSNYSNHNQYNNSNYYQGGGGRFNQWRDARSDQRGHVYQNNRYGGQQGGTAGAGGGAGAGLSMQNFNQQYQQQYSTAAYYPQQQQQQQPQGQHQYGAQYQAYSAGSQQYQQPPASSQYPQQQQQYMGYQSHQQAYGGGSGGGYPQQQQGYGQSYSQPQSSRYGGGGRGGGGGGRGGGRGGGGYHGVQQHQSYASAPQMYPGQQQQTAPPPTAAAAADVTTAGAVPVPVAGTADPYASGGDGSAAAVNSMAGQFAGMSVQPPPPPQPDAQQYYSSGGAGPSSHHHHQQQQYASAYAPAVAPSAQAYQQQQSRGGYGGGYSYDPQQQQQQQYSQQPYPQQQYSQQQQQYDYNGNDGGGAPTVGNSAAANGDVNSGTSNM